MKYTFPWISKLEHVLPYVEDHDDFVVAERDFGYVINYVVQTNDTFRHIKYPETVDLHSDEFEQIILRECRGLIFNKQGKLISRPYHKFFNLNEREETMDHNIDLSKPHMLLEKLDGSMIRPIWTEETAGGIGGPHLRLGTKMGITEVALQAEEWMADKPHYREFMVLCRGLGLTPIFEWCSRKNKVVIDHSQERLVLTAVRDVYTGDYAPYSALVGDARHYGIDYVKAFPSSGSVKELAAFIASQTDTEGYVLRFEDGHCVKIKTDWYVALHKLKEQILSEKNVIALILDERMDDIRPKLDPDDRKAIEMFEIGFHDGLLKQAQYLRDNFKQWRGMDRKQFALTVAKTLLPIQTAAVFKAWDAPELLIPTFYDGIRRLTKTSTSIDGARHIWGGARYNRASNGE